MWETPKTDWIRTDPVNYEDFNRIKNNIAYLIELEKVLYEAVDSVDMREDITERTDLPYADDFNAIENNLSNLMKNFEYIKYMKSTWTHNSFAPANHDFNRHESTCLKLYEMLNAQCEARPSMSFTLGGGSIKV